jgi:hypothetical protein
MFRLALALLPLFWLVACQKRTATALPSRARGAIGAGGVDEAGWRVDRRVDVVLAN